MQRPVGFIEEGKIYDITVTKILSKGIIVQINDSEFTEFIHVSKISHEYVSNINEFVKVGDRLTAYAIKRNSHKNRNEPELSLLHLHLQSSSNISFSTDARTHSSESSAETRLEDMIQSANLTLRDKLQTLQTRTERRRKNYKHNHKS